MKRFLTFIILMAYITVSSGAVVTASYCMMGKNETKTMKACCKKAGKMKCCKTDSKLVKINDSHEQSIVAFAAINVALAQVPQAFIFISAPSAKVSLAVHYADSSPPDKELKSIYIRNCTFLI